MLRILFPHGSRRRQSVKHFVKRVRQRRVRDFHKRQYNDLRQEYYRNVPKLHMEQTAGPLISIVVPCFNTPDRYFRELIDSVFAQGYDNWELVLIDASADKEISQRIYRTSLTDSRILYKKVPNKGIAINTNIGIEIAKGEYVAFLDHDDTLDFDALASNAQVILDHSPDLIYSDEDKVTDDGLYYFEPHFKPDFSLTLLRCVNYITHFVVVRKEIAEKVGLIEEGYDGAQDYNFLLHVVDETDKIHHIPKILYHWRQAPNSTAADFSNKQSVTDAGERALVAHLKRRQLEGTPKALPNRPGFYEIVYQLQEKRRAIIIDLPHLKNKQVEFVKSAFSRHREVKQYGIQVISGSKDALKSGDFEEVIYISHPIIPTNYKDHSVNYLFGNLGSGGDFVGIKCASRGKITDCGIVVSQNRPITLFAGMDPTMPQYFGSSEWNRNVNGLNWGVICSSVSNLLKQNTERPIFGDDIRVIGQAEYMELDGYTGADDQKEQNSSDYFNSNLSFEMYPRLIKAEALSEKIKIEE